MQKSQEEHDEGYKVRLSVLCFLFLITPFFAHASSLEIRTEGFVNGLLKLSVYASTPQNKPFNAASALISYPTDILKLESVDTTNSIFSLWGNEPKDENGKINFSGGTPAKGGFIFDGKLFSLFMRVKENGAGSVSIDNGKILASDGLGTDILTRTVDYNFRVEPAIPSYYDSNKDGTVSIQELSIGMVKEL